MPTLTLNLTKQVSIIFTLEVYNPRTFCSFIRNEKIRPLHQKNTNVNITVFSGMKGTNSWSYGDLEKEEGVRTSPGEVDAATAWMWTDIAIEWGLRSSWNDRIEPCLSRVCDFPHVLAPRCSLCCYLSFSWRLWFVQVTETKTNFSNWKASEAVRKY